MMIRTATETEITNVACGLWALLNDYGAWSGSRGEFNLVKSGACAIVAHLAYCAIGADERERRNRAKVVPCGVYQRLIEADEFDFPAIMHRRADFAEVEVIRTKYFVAILVPARENRLFVGVRGTQFAYDWPINVNIIKARDRESGDYFHLGFMREARKLAEALSNHLSGRYSGRFIYLTGHSLGGAIAALMNRWQPFDGCYTFGSPRIGNIKRFGYQFEPYSMRRLLDIIPHCPPAAFRYADLPNQMSPDGNPFQAADAAELYFFGSWLLQLSVGRFPEHHAMERYRLELMDAVKQDENYARWLKDCPEIAV
jgi:hypothetical protein